MCIYIHNNHDKRIRTGGKFIKNNSLSAFQYDNLWVGCFVCEVHCHSLANRQASVVKHFGSHKAWGKYEISSVTSNRACSLVVPLEAQKRLGRFWCKNISNSQCPNVNHGLRPHHIANKSAKSSVCFDIQGPKGCVLRRFMLEEKRNMYIHTCTAALMLAMSKRKPFQQSFSPAVGWLIFICCNLPV